MKKFLLISLLSIFWSMHIWAQPGEGPRKKVEEMRRNVYARVLVLSDDEAKKFWPVFETMSREMDENRREIQKLRKQVNQNYANMSDADMDKTMEKMFSLEQKQLDIKRKYYPEFKKVLPVKKVVLLPRAEREFKKELLQKFRDMPPPPEDDDE